MELPIGQEIAKRRKDKQITQTELADFMSVSKASVSKWEYINLSITKSNILYIR